MPPSGQCPPRGPGWTGVTADLPYAALRCSHTLLEQEVGAQRPHSLDEGVESHHDVQAPGKATGLRALLPHF